MSFRRFYPFSVGCVLAVLVSVAPAVLGQVTTQQTTQPTTQPTTQAGHNPSMTARSIPSGSKMKFRGVVISRNGDVFTIRDRSRADYQVLITDQTSVKTYGGFLSGGKKYPVTDILRGLIVEVEGRVICPDRVRQAERRLLQALSKARHQVDPLGDPLAHHRPRERRLGVENQ